MHTLTEEQQKELDRDRKIYKAERSSHRSLLTEDQRQSASHRVAKLAFEFNTFLR